jgi:hypothetical protein
MHDATLTLLFVLLIISAFVFLHSFGLFQHETKEKELSREYYGYSDSDLRELGL